MRCRGPTSWHRRPRPAATATRSGARPRATCPTSAHSLFGRDPDAFRVVTRPDGSAVAAGDVVTNHPLAEVLDLVAREGASVLTHRRDRSGDGRRHGRPRWPGHPPRPRRVHARWCAPGAPHRRRLGPRGQPAAVGRRADARGDARRAAAPGQLALARHHRHPALGAALPAQGARPRARPRRRGARAAALGRPARPGRAADELEHRQHLRRRPRRHRLRGHRLERLRRRHHRARHRAAAQQRPRRARAQQARAAPPRPGHPARVEHGAHHGAHRRRPGARHRLARGRPDHDRADARARPGLPARRRPAGTPSRPRACTCASTRTAWPSSSTRRCRDRRRGAPGGAARARPRHPADVLRWGGGGLPPGGRRAPGGRRPSPRGRGRRGRRAARARGGRCGSRR